MNAKKAYKNRFSGPCCVSGKHVAAGAGWVSVNSNQEWSLYSDSVAREQGFDLVEAEVSEVKGDKFGKKKSGVTTGLGVTECFAKVFRDNEDRASGRIAGDPWSDEEISDFMMSEFPDSTPESRSVSRIRMYRTCYNESTHSFAGAPKPKVPSQRYESKNQRSQNGISESRVRQIAREESANAAAAVLHQVSTQLKEQPIVHVSFSKTEIKKVDSRGKHVQFVDALKRVEAGVPLFLVGPAGCGKTHLASQVADAMGLDFTFNSMSEGVSESSLLGRMLPDSKGVWKYQPSPFVKSYQEGGVHLLDEIDAADPNLLVAINAAIANGQLSLPFAQSEPIKRHKKSVIIAAANTYGNGADRQYVGRNQLDAATMDRFRMGTVEMDYDRDIERAIVGAILSSDDAGESPTAYRGRELLEWGWKMREAIATAKIRRVMSTRNLADAARLMGVGLSLADVKKTYFSGWSDDEKRKVPS